MLKVDIGVTLDVMKITGVQIRCFFSPLKNTVSPQKHVRSMRVA